MKTFRYSKGNLSGRTMTVMEMKELLSRYPDDMPVMALWEGCNAFIESVEVDSVCKGLEEDRADCLVFDVGEY